VNTLINSITNQTVIQISTGNVADWISLTSPTNKTTNSTVRISNFIEFSPDPSINVTTGVD